jgi:hypothetical protein
MVSKLMFKLPWRFVVNMYLANGVCAACEYELICNTPGGTHCCREVLKDRTLPIYMH